MASEMETLLEKAAVRIYRQLSPRIFGGSLEETHGEIYEQLKPLLSLLEAADRVANVKTAFEQFVAGEDYDAALAKLRSVKP